jgi:hypothetical protein
VATSDVVHCAGGVGCRLQSAGLQTLVDAPQPSRDVAQRLQIVG